jgi:hypothetical protein
VTQPDVCGACRAALDDSSTGEGAERAPCPECGSLLRIVAESITDFAVGKDYLCGEQRRKDIAIWFSESPRGGLASNASLLDDNSIESLLTGGSPRGEDDTVAVCRTLVGRLNQLGADWSDPQPGEGDEDCVAFSASESPGCLKIQVVRAEVSQEFWSQAARRRTAGVIAPAQDFADRIRRAIELKLKIPEAQRRSLLLLLDASRLPGYALDAPTESFRALHGGWANSLGFREIWIAGPTLSLTARLDGFSEAENEVGGRGR